MWTTEIVFADARSLSLSSLLLCLQKWSFVLARSLVHSAELFNVISFSILSADFFYEKEKKKIYVYI